MTDDEKAIRETIATWMTESKAGNVDAVLALMTDDAMFLTAQQPPFGKTEFGARMAGMKDIEFEGASDIQEVVISGDLAYVRANLTIHIKLADGKEMDRAGPALSIFRKTAGKWQICRDANMVK